MANITLRDIKMEDAENIVKWKNNKNVKKNFCIQEDLTVETHMNWYTNKILTGQVKQFIIQDKELKMEVGSTYLRDIDLKNKKAEFGIFIGEDLARGRGIGSKSVELTVKYAFEKLKLHKVFLRVFSGNIPAIKSYEKAGFEYEGTAKDDILLPNGEYQDVIFMAIINEREER